MIGITGYGIYIPSYRIKVDDILSTWQNNNLAALRYKLKLAERAVCDYDEDVVTMAVEASKNALASAGVHAGALGSLFFGSCTSPYSMKPVSTILLDALGGASDSVTGDVQFSCKSGTLAVSLAAALAEQTGKPGLAVGSDNLSAYTEPGDPFEYCASAGAAALLVGKTDPIAEIQGFATHNTDTPDIFRLEGDRYLTTGGNAMLQSDVGQPFHTAAAFRALLARMGAKPGDFNYVVFHQGYGVTPFMLGKALGFTEAQILPGVIAENLGDTGSASVLIGLANVLDRASKGERILAVSYGPGAGSDAIALQVTDRIDQVRPRTKPVKEMIEEKQYIDYAAYAKLDRKYQKKGGA